MSLIVNHQKLNTNEFEAFNERKLLLFPKEDVYAEI